MTRYYCLFLILIISFKSYSQENPLAIQTGVYMTEKDFLNNNLTEMDEFMRIDALGIGLYANYIAFFKKNGEKVKFSASDIWGFRNNSGVLYRVTEDFAGNEMFVVLLVGGKLSYYRPHFGQGAFWSEEMHGEIKLFMTNKKIKNTLTKEYYNAAMDEWYSLKGKQSLGFEELQFLDNIPVQKDVREFFAANPLTYCFLYYNIQEKGLREFTYSIKGDKKIGKRFYYSLIIDS